MNRYPQLLYFTVFTPIHIIINYTVYTCTHTHNATSILTREWIPASTKSISNYRAGIWSCCDLIRRLLYSGLLYRPSKSIKNDILIKFFFKKLPPKTLPSPILYKFLPQRKPFSREIFPLQGIIILIVKKPSLSLYILRSFVPGQINFQSSVVTELYICSQKAYWSA